MKKIYSSLMALCFGMAMNTQAQTVTAETLSATFPNYEVTNFYNFVAWTKNDEALPGTDWAISGTSSFRVASADMYQVTTEGLTDFYLQSTDTRHRTDRAQGIFNYGSGARRISIADLKAGMIVVLDGATSNTNYTYDSTAPVDETTVDVLTDSIHEAQTAAAGEEGESESTADTYKYYRIKEDGRFDFYLNRANYMLAIVILADASAPEYVTAPTLKFTAVDGTARKLMPTAGVSSKGNSVTSWYSVDGSDPLFLEDTDVIASADTVWNEGHTDYTLENIVYVQRAVYDEEAQAWGDLQAEDGVEITVSDLDDEDGDGIVTVKLASVSETGIASSIISMDVSVGEIQLNAPTLSLVGIDGTKRGYKLGWVNNLITDTEHTFVTEVDDGETDQYAEDSVIWAADHIKVTVSAEGYTSNEVELDDLVQKGIEYVRKDASKLHDWDFQNFSDELLARIEGTEVDFYYTVDENGDTVKYDEESAPEVAEVAYKTYGWWYDSTRSRAWRVVQTDTIHTVAADGVTDSTYVVASYEDDRTGLLDGLTLTCDPYLSSAGAYAASYAVYVTGGGLYNMSAMTLQIPSVQYGEYVIISTYGNTICLMCEDATEGLSTSIARMSYLYYIDVYTTADPGDLPDAIAHVEADDACKGNVYSTDGRLVRRNAQSLSGLKPGIYIQNGHKYIVK